jgi:peptidoglycan/LPS O-acetylase OafA/YrhL
MSKKNPRLAFIDYLRLFTSITVCVSHVLGALRNSHHLLSPLNDIFGYTIIFRVPLLFVISGFVVCLSIINRAQTFSMVCHFLARRSIWILIPLWLALIFTYIYEKLLWFGGFPHVPQRTPIDVISNVLCITPFTNTRRWIDPTWSLTYELQYYFITALVWMLSLTRGIRRRYGLTFILAVLALMLISSILDYKHHSETVGIWHFRWFGLGLLAGMRLSNAMYTWFFRSGILIVGIASIFEGGGYLVATKIILVAALLVVIETDGVRRANTFLRSSPIFGTISYLIYLVHWPIASHSWALVHLCRRMSLDDDYWPLFAILIPIGVSVLLAKPVYRLCEWVKSILLAKNESTSLSGA